MIGGPALRVIVTAAETLTSPVFIAAGELASVEIEPLRISDLAGTYRDDPALREAWIVHALVREDGRFARNRRGHLPKVES